MLLALSSPAPRATHNTIYDNNFAQPSSYSQSLAAVKAARGELERLSVPHQRPSDYLAEMLKTDAHMKKIKDKLLTEQAHLTAVEVRRRQKESEKFRKAAAAQKSLDRAKEKKATLDSTKQWRKSGIVPHDMKGSSGGGGGSGGEKMRGQGPDRGAGAGGGGFAKGGGGGGPSFKRARKDEKYGFGGKPKRLEKQNDAKSSKEMRGFSVAKMKGKPGKGGGKGGSRPGKAARARGKGGKPSHKGK